MLNVSYSFFLLHMLWDTLILISHSLLVMMDEYWDAGCDMRERVYCLWTFSHIDIYRGWVDCNDSAFVT